MNVQRGDIVVCVIAGDYGKSRPAVVVQSDLFNPYHARIVVCPITSYLVEAQLFRLQLKPTLINGLVNESQIMVDKLTAIRVEKITHKIGKLITGEVEQLNRALKLWLDVL